jgi:hypothetical protein
VRRQLFLLLVLPLLAGCGSVGASLPTAHAASPQHAELGWVESIGDTSGRIVFGVRSFDVTRAGWKAQISIANDTDVPFAVGGTMLLGTPEYGLMLFSTGAHSELEERNARNALPTIRPAERFVPSLPSRLEAHKSWSGAISAGGPVAAGTWVRVVFGPLLPVTAISPAGQPSKPTPQLPETLRKAHVDQGLVWITDHAYELKR